MAGTTLQNRSSEREREREIARRSDYGFREPFGSGPMWMMRRFSEEMDRFFANSISRFRGGEGMWSPAIEVRERDGNLEITAELPGMKKEDLKVECTDEGLIIEGEKHQEHQETEGEFFRSERSYGRFYRRIPLPAGVEPDKVRAEFKDGILRVSVPVPEGKRQGRSVPIDSK